MEILLTFFLDFTEFLASLPGWGEIWCLGFARKEGGKKRENRALQIAFGAEFLVLFVAALAGLILDLAVARTPFYYIWLGAFAVIAAQTVLGIVLLVVRRVRAK